MTDIKSYKDLIIWQKGIEIVDLVYVLPKSFPKEEVFSLTSQIKRCSVSIPSNIAEGWGRGSEKSFLNFLDIARGSLYELETQIEIATRQEYLDEEARNQIVLLLTEESKMLSSFMNKLKSRITSH